VCDRIAGTQLLRLRLLGTDSSQTHRWRGLDSNLQFRAEIGFGFTSRTLTVFLGTLAWLRCRVTLIQFV
jgi:hypothetical protein